MPSLRNLTYKERFIVLDLKTLANRRTREQTRPWLLKGIVNLNYINFLKSTTTKTRAHGPKLFKLFEHRNHLNVKQNVFWQRMVESWNELPEGIVNFTTVLHFETTLWYLPQQVSNPLFDILSYCYCKKYETIPTLLMSNEASNFRMGTAELSLSKLDDDPRPHRAKYDLEVLRSVLLRNGFANTTVHRIIAVVSSKAVRTFTGPNITMLLWMHVICKSAKLSLLGVQYHGWWFVVF